MSESTPEPLQDLDDWEEDLLRRYPSPAKHSKPASTDDRDSSNSRNFRNYEEDTKPWVREFYRLNHRYQTFEFVEAKQAEFLSLNRERMGIWQAMEYLNELVDDSDPDIDLPQIEHLLQTAEAIRRDGRPDWFILAGLIHDLGKILCLWGEPQWAVVGDTFPLGCQFSQSIVFYKFFELNPDWGNLEYQSPCGIYEPNCGLDQVQLSWGHDEYLYHVVKDYLPREALAMIRYHSCYPIHREGAYRQLLNAADLQLLDWVREFNQYDLYTKRDERMNVAELKPFYSRLISNFFPHTLAW